MFPVRKVLFGPFEASSSTLQLRGVPRRAGGVHARLGRHELLAAGVQALVNPVSGVSGIGDCQQEGKQDDGGEPPAPVVPRPIHQSLRMKKRAPQRPLFPMRRSFRLGRGCP